MGNYLGICWQYIWEHPWASVIVGIITAAFTPPIKKIWTKIVVKLLENWLTRIMTWWRGNSSESNSDTNNDQGEVIEHTPHVNNAEAGPDGRNTTRCRRKEDLDDRPADSGSRSSVKFLAKVKARNFMVDVNEVTIDNREIDNDEEISRDKEKMAEKKIAYREARKPKKVNAKQKGERTVVVEFHDKVETDNMIAHAEKVKIGRRKVKEKKEQTTGCVQSARSVEEVNKDTLASTVQRHGGQPKKFGTNQSTLGEITQEKTVIFIGGCRLKLSAHSVKEPTMHDIKYNIVPVASPGGHIHASSTLTFNPPFQGRKSLKISLPTWCSSEASVLVGIFTETEEGEWKELDRPNLTHEGHLELHYRYLSNITAFLPRDRLPDINFKISCFLYNNADWKFAMGFCLADEAIENMFQDRLEAKGFVPAIKTLEPLMASFEDEIEFKIIPGQPMTNIQFNVDEQFLSSHQGYISYCNTNADTCEYKITQKRKLDLAVGNQAGVEQIIDQKTYSMIKK
uniref:uncharacterized protein LOC120335751 n=1 Tax=Styela clava TaxID=7725 RepID=UPI0019394AF1|nr:uncharacterized protein LOC120335751 [Styela clava]XP_039259305.1 uncharacterized protein LOC120335751 [Styela clava]